MFIKHNRVIGEAISILKGTNEAYASSTQNLDKVKDGSFIRIAGEGSFYVIRKKEEFNYTNKFTIASASSIIIPEKAIPKLQEGDKVKLTFHEQELDMVLGILDGGKGYIFGDILTLEEGSPSLDIKTGQLFKIQIKVNGVNEEGAVTRILIASRGRYIKTPEGPFSLSGGKGRGVKLDLNFLPLTTPTIIEKVIVHIDSRENDSLVILNSVLPVSLSEGNISCNKWLLILSTSLCEDDKIAERYSISSDFSPVLQLPLMAANSFTLDIVYNHSMMRLEEEILELRRTIQELKKS